jgi:hypothetical protein
MATQSINMGPSAIITGNPAGSITQQVGPNLWVAFYELAAGDTLFIGWFGRGRSRGVAQPTPSFRSSAIIEQIRINRASVADTADVYLYPGAVNPLLATPIAQIAGASPSGAVVASGQNVLSNDPDGAGVVNDSIYITGPTAGSFFVWALLREDV